MHSQEFTQKMKERLEEEKTRLQEELAGLPEHTELGDDMDSGATEYQVDEVNSDIRSQFQNDIELIDIAIQKIANGTYGICSVGGEDISEARLEVLPWADKCVEHQDA